MLKKCTKCNTWKPISEFYKHKEYKDGLSYWCKTCFKKYYKKQYLENDKRRMRSKQYYSTPHGKYLKYKKESIRRKLIFNLNEEDFTKIVLQPCYYCGKPARPINGIDRIDNTKGYIKNNCVPCCSTCNRMKGILTKEIFIEKCKQIVKKQNI